jgi:hypothetical protein
MEELIFYLVMETEQDFSRWRIGEKGLEERIFEQ